MEREKYGKGISLVNASKVSGRDLRFTYHTPSTTLIAQSNSASSSKENSGDFHYSQKKHQNNRVTPINGEGPTLETPISPIHETPMEITTSK